MTWRDLLRPWKRSPDTTGEAQAHLLRLTEQDEEITRLGGELRDRLARNHFSEMVTLAISRRAERGA